MRRASTNLDLLATLHVELGLALALGDTRPLHLLALSSDIYQQLGEAASVHIWRSGRRNHTMSSSVSPFTALPAIRASLLHNRPEAVPATDELEQLHAELTSFKQKSLERAKKASDDMRAIEESMRRLKEKEKGKAKALQKVERERGCACYFIQCQVRT